MGDEGRSFDLECDVLRGASAELLELRGKEAVSKPYRFDLRLRVARGASADLPADLVGARAVLVVRGVVGARRIHGVIDEATLEAEPQKALSGDILSVRLVPGIALLSRSRRSRIFQAASVPEVVAHVLEPWGVALRIDLERDYAQRDHCTQYMESDLAFVQRILAEEGIAWVVDQDEDAGTETVRLVDEVAFAAPLPGGSTLVYADVEGLAEQREDVTAFRVERRAVPSRVELREFDFERPSYELTASAEAPDDADRRREIYEHHGQHGGLDVHPAAATRRLEQARRRAHRASGASRCPRLEAGRSFELSRAPHPGHEGAWLVVEVAHRGRLGVAAPEMHGTYDNTFRCVPRSVMPRPRARRRSIQESLQTAIVVGPAGQEIHTDVHGRVRVQFHWDREGRHDEHASCWIRVAHGWSGVGFGFQHVPRIGMEVLVAFVGGDPDRPLVVGAVPNAEHPVPFQLPQHKTRSGIRTQSSRGGGGFHELSFEDRAGHERIFLRSQRDLEEEVLHDHFATVGHDSTSTVGATSTTQIGADRFLVVGGSSVVAVTGDATRTIGGVERVAIEGSTERTVALGEAVTVGGDASRTVRGAEEVHVEGGRRSRVEGPSNATFAADAVFVAERRAAAQAHEALEVDAARVDARARRAVALRAGEDDDTSSLLLEGGGAAVRADRVLALRAEEAIELTVGDTTIELRKDGVRIAAKTIDLAGTTIRALGDGASLLLSGDVSIFGGTIAMESKRGSSLELGAAAKLDGPAIKLGEAAAAERVKKAEREAQKATVKKTKLHLFDHRGELCRGGRYEVSAPGWIDTGTSASGIVEVPVFPDAEVCTLRWGRAQSDREPGASSEPIEYEAVVHLATEVSDPEEALRRKLANLGHRDADLERALASFEAQKERRAPAERAALAAEVGDHHEAQMLARAKQGGAS